MNGTELPEIFRSPNSAFQLHVSKKSRLFPRTGRGISFDVYGLTFLAKSRGPRTILLFEGYVILRIEKLRRTGIIYIVPLKLDLGTVIRLLEGRLSDQTTQLNIDNVLQHPNTNWCWAACAAMVVKYYARETPRQCFLASKLFGAKDCCQSPSSKACNKGLETDDVRRVFYWWAIDSQHWNGAKTFSEIAFEIGLKRPVQICMQQDGGYHMVLIIRTYTDKGQPCYTVNDPLFGCRAASDSDLKTAFGHGLWKDTWTDIKR
jgi:Papain-like cysteine protease AvrRpt2